MTVVAMCGATQVSASVNLDVVVKPAGVTVTKDTDATQPTLTIAVANTVTAGDVVDIPVVQIDNGNITIHKLWLEATLQLHLPDCLQGQSGSGRDFRAVVHRHGDHGHE